jgi:hypothetical protein
MPDTVTDRNITLLARVKRGPHWCKGDQDGGKGMLGTVVAFRRRDGKLERDPSISEANGSKVPERTAVVSAFVCIWLVCYSFLIYLGEVGSYKAMLLPNRVERPVPFSVCK